MAQEQRQPTTYEATQAASDKETQLRKQVALNTEKLEILDGTRSDKPEIMKKMAVRVIDMRGILEMPLAAQCQPTFMAAPTAAEMNQIVWDIWNLYTALSTVSDTLRTVIIPQTKPRTKLG